jgi:hypothetical protein
MSPSHIVHALCFFLTVAGLYGHPVLQILRTIFKRSPQIRLGDELLLQLLHWLHVLPLPTDDGLTARVLGSSSPPQQQVLPHLK